MKRYKILLIIISLLFFTFVSNPMYANSSNIIYYSNFAVKPGDEMTYSFFSSNPNVVAQLTLINSTYIFLPTPNGTLITVLVNKTGNSRESNINYTELFEQFIYTLPDGNQYTSSVLIQAQFNSPYIKEAFPNETALKEYLNATDYPKASYTIKGNLIDFNESRTLRTEHYIYNWKTGWLESHKIYNYANNHTLLSDYLTERVNNPNQITIDPVFLSEIIIIPIAFAIGVFIAVRLKKKK